jgi:hypothetical protein
MLGAAVRSREQRIFPVERNYPSILPISGKMLKSFIAGMRFMVSGVPRSPSRR